MANGEWGASARFSAIRDIQGRNPRKFAFPTDESGRPLRISEYFGQNTFNLDQMKRRLPKEVFQKLQSTIDSGKKLDLEIANTVAQAIKEWALERGVTHFCHWFQPQTGSTAEKHDAFISFDGQHRVIEKFSGSQLIQSEPDASSFPSGGMRTTFEARGYTAWDPSSPVFVMESTNGKTLCIPSVFLSYHGDSLDEKTALIRSMEVLSERARELLRQIGDSAVSRVTPTLGVEQEYFLVDRAFVAHRPDLMMTGRTLFGGQPPKGQQLEDHYFGSIPSRVQAFMSEVELELYKLGVPVKTRHNEVAPSQFETAPIFEEANVAVDHNQLTMEVLRKVALRHQFHALLHEKPFAGVNGSGKHCNWSMSLIGGGSDDGENLLEPGRTPHQNLRFLLVLVSVLRGVHKHGGLLRASIASSGNDHRLGANEAPPAIISVFLGEQLTKILDSIERGEASGSNTEAAVLKLGVNKLPEVLKDNTDRNRTSPFAFTGNKFEFRAVGSSASPAFPVTVLNTVVAEAMAEITDRLRKKMSSGKSRDESILELVREVTTETKAIRFEGNGYSEEWVKEAAKRGLPNLRKSPEALAQMASASSKSLMKAMGVLTEAELVSRCHVRTERYVKNLLIEVDTIRQMVDTQVLPAGFAYHGILAGQVAACKNAGIDSPQADTLQKLCALLNSLKFKREELEIAYHQVESLESEEEKALALSQTVSVRMQELRKSCDELEAVIADDFWPLPKYREMLFIS
ncbi:MAG: glutamine synthetase III [Bdellovibrionales bacterium]|nr:glutamine synthetase III [Bdellovibrionales bacterium]